jgi:hypothetical protein
MVSGRKVRPSLRYKFISRPDQVVDRVIVRVFRWHTPQEVKQLGCGRFGQWFPVFDIRGIRLDEYAVLQRALRSYERAPKVSPVKGKRNGKAATRA